MSNEDAQLIKIFLEMKYKAAIGTRWTKDEKAIINHCLERHDAISILAACCVLSSQRWRKWRRSLEIVQKAIEGRSVQPYVELSIYEALVFVPIRNLASFYDAIFLFIEQSLSKRGIDLTNTIFLLGNLVRVGQGRALTILESLAVDPNPEVRENASLVLSRLNEQ